MSFACSNIHVQDSITGEELYLFAAHRDRVLCLALSIYRQIDYFDTPDPPGKHVLVSGGRYDL